MFFKVLLNEIVKDFFNAWSYRWQWVGEFFSLALFFFFLHTLSQKTDAGIPYAIWFYSILVIGDISSKVMLEMRSGTFEQIYLSSVPITLIFFSKIVSSVFKSLCTVGPLMFFLWSIGLLSFGSFNFNFFYVLLAITPGLFGISLFLAGLTIVFKDVGWIINILNNSLLFLTGIFVPLEYFSDRLRVVFSFVPTAQAIRHIDKISVIDFFEVLIFNFLYFLVGLLVFIFFEKKAKKNGVLGHY